MLPKNWPESKRSVDWLHNLMNCVTVSLCFWSCGIFSFLYLHFPLELAQLSTSIFLKKLILCCFLKNILVSPLFRPTILHRRFESTVQPIARKSTCLLSLYLYLTYCFLTPEQLAKFTELLCLCSLKANARKPWLNKPMNYLFVEESSKTVSLIKACIICPWFQKILQLF